MRSGQLRHLVTIQQLLAGSPQQKPSGEPDTSWVDFATVYAAIEPLKGRELFAAQAVNAKTDTRIRLRYLAGMDESMRVVFGGAYYNIEAIVDPELRHIELQLMCNTGSNDG